LIVHTNIDDFWLSDAELTNLSQNLPSQVAESLRKKDERNDSHNAKDLIEGLRGATIGYCAACWYLNSGVGLPQLEDVLQQTLETLEASKTLTTEAGRAMAALALNDATADVRTGSPRAELVQAWRRNAISGAWRIVNLRTRAR
jgi:hypothetical protein